MLFQYQSLSDFRTERIPENYQNSAIWFNVDSAEITFLDAVVLQKLLQAFQKQAISLAAC
jgi:hypothetical protein